MKLPTIGLGFLEISLYGASHSCDAYVVCLLADPVSSTLYHHVYFPSKSRTFSEKIAEPRYKFEPSLCERSPLTTSDLDERYRVSDIG